MFIAFVIDEREIINSFTNLYVVFEKLYKMFKLMTGDGAAVTIWLEITSKMYKFEGFIEFSWYPVPMKTSKYL